MKEIMIPWQKFCSVQRTWSSYQAIHLSLGLGHGALGQSRWWKFWISSGYLIQPMISGPRRERVRESTKRNKRRQRLMALEDPKHCGKLVNFKGTPKSSTHHPTPGIELRSGACLCLSEVLNNRRYENIFNEINTRTWIKYECMAIDERSSVLLCMYNSKTSEVWKY